MTNRDYVMGLDNEKLAKLMWSKKEEICDSISMKTCCYNNCLECIKKWLETERNPKVERGQMRRDPTEPSHVESYDLYVLDRDSKSNFVFYGSYEVKSEDVYSRERYGNVITFYCTTGGTRIIFASNGITIISPKGYIESFTQGYMQRG